ncbi:uncharacterized protein LOC128735455 [Sabethes cyaneus]|uniref:uncharacterized protein LOC128735455 n=1 Tax=Sabethes cyaneus TaxID=53552 RepID=UPI00237E2946|nr:uncharacterized protein LOC128735455 [Sabethes cyaneus]
MSSRYRSLTEMLHSTSKESESESPVKSQKNSKKENDKRFSVRKLVHQFEASASEHFERTFSSRFSSRWRKPKASSEDAEAAAAVEEQKCSSGTTLWYLDSSDKITEDSDELRSASMGAGLDDLFDRISFPDPDDICDSYNEFIYLRLSAEKAEYLNSYDSDFEIDENESITEASNTVIALKFPGDYVHYLIYGYYQSKSISYGDVTVQYEEDDGFSESEASVFSDSDNTSTSKTIYLIEELLDTERNYINTLEKGISTYINNLFNKVPVPKELVNMKYHLFGNIEYIHQFHKSILLPKLCACGDDSGKIGDVFSKYLENDSFYGYVLYSLYHPKSQRLCEQFARFFENHQNSSGDRLGVKSFILQPIQRLPRYKLLLANLAKALQANESSFDEKVATQHQLVCKAERLLEHFINTMNESMQVNDIVECEQTDDDEIEMGFGVPKPVTVLREQNSENQILFLYPKDHDRPERNKPINILHQGKFKKVFPVFLHDLRLMRQYPGKLFLFERCVIYTEQTKQKTLSYRGHFDQKEVSFDFSNHQILKIASEKDNLHLIDVKVDIKNPEATDLSVIVDLLRAIIEKRRKKEGFIIESTELAIVRNAIMNRDSGSRSSFSSITSNFSYYNTCGPDSVADESSLDYYPTIQFASNGPSMNHILSFHQYYEKALKDSIDFYIHPLPNDVRQQLVDLNEILLGMLKFQRNLNYRLFEEERFEVSETEMSIFCDIFHDNLKQSEFEIFLRYVEKSKCAEAILMSFEQYFSGRPWEENTICLSIDAFLFLPVEYINRCCDFFDVVWRDVHGSSEQVILRNTVLDYKINYVRSQLSQLRQRVNENYYIRQLIMDTDFLNEIQLAQYSELVKLEGSYASYRLFLTKTGLLCLKIKTDKPENYSSVTFYCPYTKSSARNSHRSHTRWFVYLDGRKTTLIFDSKTSRHVLNERYTVLAEQMRAKMRVKKRSFFKGSE